MASNCYQLLTYVCLLFLSCVFASEVPAWHMKPIGSHIEPEKVDETHLTDVISPADFAKNYVLPGKPLIFRDIVKLWPAYKLWTDEYLIKNYGEMEMRLEAKKEKQGMIPKGDVCLGRDRLKTFLKDYREGADKYIVSDLPSPMYKDVFVPPPLACGEFAKSFVEVDIWVNSDMGKKGNGGNSIIHKDAYNTINCVVNGTKEWKLFELKYNDYMYQSWEGPMDAGYGGFSLVNPDKVDAKEFPDVGKIPHWQFATINAGDCFFLPSQMWHQVKSFGETNRAVAFLFQQYQGRTDIDTTECGKSTIHIPLSAIDVDWPYVGHGMMPMGHSEIVRIYDTLYELLNRTSGLITKRMVYRTVYRSHSSGAINKKVILKKAKVLYAHLLTIANGNQKKMSGEFIKKLTRDQIRATYDWLFPIEPANSYEHEYSAFLPEEIGRLMSGITIKDGVIKKDDFLEAYQSYGGTERFAREFWGRLAGDKTSVDQDTGNFTEAIRPYEEHRRNAPDEEDEEATLTTPQGHTSQPKKRRGGYGYDKEDEKIQHEKKEERNEAEENDHLTDNKEEL